MTAPLVQRLQLVVDATTGQAETRWGKLTQAAQDTARASTSSASDVQRAADRVAQAQLKQADAAGAVRTAQDRLNDLHAKGVTSGAQLTRAEEGLASAQRRLHLASREAATALDAETAAQRDAADAAGQTEQAHHQAAEGSGRLRGQLDDLKGSVVGLVAGVSLADWAADSYRGFLDGARGANALAQSMNATIEQGGQLSQLFASLGLEAGDLLEIQAEFATKIGAGGSELAKFGAEVKKNDDGTVNWALTLEDALVQLQKIPDATERNATGFRLFGEEGYKQLSRLLTSGMSVEEALARIGTPITDEDVASVQQYDAAMTRLSLASGDLGRTLARGVVPFVAGLAEAGTTLLGVLDGIPTPTLAVTAALVAMRVTGFSPTAKAAELAIDTVGKIHGAWGRATAGVSGDAGRMSRAVGGVRSAAGGLAGVAGGPLGIAMIAASVGFSEASEGADDLAAHAHDAAVRLAETAAAGKQSADAQKIALGNTANDLEENAGYWERSAAYVKGYQEDLSGVELAAAKVLEPFQRLTMGLGDTTDTAQGFELAIQEAKDELGEFGAQQAVAQATTTTLNDLIAQGATEGKQFGDAVAAAAGAQADQERTSGLAAAAIDAYKNATSGASAAVWDLINAQYASEDAGFAWQQALDDAKDATDDQKTSVDEARQAQVQLMEAGLRAADQAADTAVAAAKAAGQIVDTTAEARIRADAMITDLRGRLDTPGLSKGARDELQGLIDKLTEAREKGDVTALVTLTGTDAAKGELDETTKDRDTTVNVESRGGPAVEDYLDRIASRPRLALVRVESRNGPAVQDYLDRVRGMQPRLALIRAESRNGPAVMTYLEQVTSNYGRGRLALIQVQTRGGPAAQAYLESLTGAAYAATVGAPSGARWGAPAAPMAGLFGGGSGGVTVENMTVQVVTDPSGRATQQSLAEAGRQAVAAIGAYERRNGPGWRSGGVRR